MSAKDTGTARFFHICALSCELTIFNEKEAKKIHVGKVKDYFGDAADCQGTAGHPAAA
jgi:hypothetical protein